jgi:hypothetical protein
MLKDLGKWRVKAEGRNEKKVRACGSSTLSKVGRQDQRKMERRSEKRSEARSM